MDVSFRNKAFYWLILPFFIISCGDRYDLSTERGRQARIDDANRYLSFGQCSNAHNAIDPLYSSNYVDDEVRIVKAGAYACQAGFNFLTLAGNLSGSNIFKSLAKSMNNTSGDSKRSYIYSAVDVLTESGAKLSASARGTKLNSFMVFLQLGVIGVNLRNYGSPATDGSKGAAIAYANPRVLGTDMTNLDACATATGFTIMTDSFTNSTLNDTTTSGYVNSLNAICVSLGYASCTILNKDRTLCTGAAADVPSVIASGVITYINNNW